MSVTKRYLVNKRDEYVMRYEKEDNGTISVHCDLHPPDPYGRGSQVHHLFNSGQICVTSGREPRTMDRAKAIAVHWMEGFSQYVRTGDFPEGSRRVTV